MIDHQRKLQKRGIHDQAMSAGWQRSQAYKTQGWQYPIFDLDGSVIATRYKAANKDAKMKYAWVGGKPDHPLADWYILPNTQDAISRAGGVCYLANGEPALLAYHTAGIHNAIATTVSETTVPRNLLDVLQSLGVTRLLYPVDNDNAGRQSGIKFRDALQATGIDFEAFSWGDDAPAKADANDMWMQDRFDTATFQHRLAHLVPLALPMPEPKRGYTSQPDTPDTTPHSLIEALISRLNVRGWRANGWSKNVSSPFHEDKKPSFGIRRDNGVGKDFATGENYSPVEIARQLGIDWQRFYPERRTAKKNTPVDDYAMSQWAQPVAMPAYTASLQVAQRYISDLDPAYFSARTLRIKSPLATGKTELFKRIIAHFERTHGRAPTVLYQTHSQPLVNDAAARLGIQSYQDVPVDEPSRQYIDLMPQLAITLDSLHFVAGREFDLIFIDEFEQNMAHIYGGTMQGQQAKQAFNTFTALLGTAGQVVLADAHLTDNLLPFIIRYRGTDGLVSVNNSYRHDWGTLTLWKDSAALIEQALDHAHRAQHPIVITSNSRTQTDLLHRIFAEALGSEAVFLINGDNSAHTTRKAFLNDINTQIATKRVVICSPTIGTGIDIQTRVSAVYGLFGRNTWGSATVTLQQMMRFRHADERHLYVQPTFNGTEESDPVSRFNWHLARARGTGRAAAFAEHHLLSDDTPHRTLLMIECIQKSARATQRNELFSYTVAYAQDEGFTLAYHEQESPLMRATLREARQALAEAQKENALTLPPVDSDTFDSLLQSGQVDRTVRHQLLRWQIERTAGQAITGELYTLLHTPRKRADFQRFLDLFARSETLQQRDREQARYDDLITKRGHYTRVQTLILKGLATVFGTDWHLNTEELTAEDISARLTPYMAAYLDDIQLYIDKRTDLSVDPLAVLRRLLKRVALKLDYRRVRRDGKLIYVYALDRAHYTRMRELASTALATRQAEQGVPDPVTNTSDKRVLEHATATSPLSGATSASQGVYTQLSTGETIFIPF